MALQTARYLVASYSKLKRGERLVGTVAYLESLKHADDASLRIPPGAAGDAALRTGPLAPLLEAFLFLLAKKVALVSEDFEARCHAAKSSAAPQSRRVPATAAPAAGGNGWTSVDDGDGAGDEGDGGEGGGSAEAQAWNALSPELLDCSKAHCLYKIAACFVDGIEQARASDDPERHALVPTLEKFCRLYLLSSLSNWLDWLLATGYVSAKQMVQIKKAIVALCADVRAVAVVSVDAFGLSDAILRSPLGRYDGRIYEAYFERVRAAPGAVMEQPPYYESEIRPLLLSSL